jgi:prephenate dehydrogenase
VRQGVLSLAAGSFRDGTRVAGTPSARTVDMLVHNREAITRSVTMVQGFLAELVDALERADVAALTSAFEEGRGLRLQLGDPTTRTTTERFPVEGDLAGEYNFLVRLGAEGGHLTSCVVEDSTVVYTACRPTSPGG